MTQHTQPVVAAQLQQQSLMPQQQPQQQHQNTTTVNPNNNNNQSNNNSNNNVSTTTSTTIASNNNNQTTQTVAVQQHQNPNNNNNNNNNNNYTGPVYNPQFQPANVLVPAHGIPAHNHSQQHHQPGFMYQAMIPAIRSNVYVNNVTANVNLHGWAHTVPYSAWVHPGGAPHYIPEDLPPEQVAPVIQSMGAMPVTLSAPNALTGPLIYPNVNAIGGSTRGSRRGRGRGGSSGSRRGDYNAAQRHPPAESIPAPQQSWQNNQQDLQQQQQGSLSSDAQQMITAVPQTYFPHPQYSLYAPQYPYGYPAFYTPPQHMLHASQSAAAQQAPVCLSTVPLYNGHQLYNYGYYPVLNHLEYQYVPGEEVGVANPIDDDRKTGAEGGNAMMWHSPPIYTDEYGNMTSGDMHVIPADEINRNTPSMGSAADTPSLLSPNYAHIYDPQLQEQMTQQMGVMQIYDDPQMGHMQVMHPQSNVPQMKEELSDCGSQPSPQIQMVQPVQLVQTSPSQMSLTAAIMPIDTNLTSNTTTSQHQIYQSITGDVDLEE